MKDQTTSIGRRQFLAAGAILPTIVSASSLGLAAAPAPSDRINVGVIGLGSRGFNLIDELLRQRDARITKVCDVDRIHHRDREWGQGPTFGIEGARKKMSGARIIFLG